MRGSTVLLAAVVLVLGAMAAGAYPTLGGATGLVTLPTAEVAPAGMVDLAVDYQKTEAAGIELKLWPARAVAGLAKNAELWFGYNRMNGNSEDATLWNGGAKYAFLQEPKDKVSLAIGGSLGRLENDGHMNEASAFLVASKNLGKEKSAGEQPSARLSAGLVWLKFGDPADYDFTKPFLGVEVFGKAGGSLALEYRFKDDGADLEAPFSSVLRYPLGGVGAPLWVEVGTTNAAFESLGNDESDFFVGVGYRFGTAK